MLKKYFAHNLYLDNEMQKNKVLVVEDGIIQNICACSSYDESADTICSGLIDQHIHGGFSFEVMQKNKEGYQNWLLSLAKRGTTGVLPSLAYTGDEEGFLSQLAFVHNLMEAQNQGKIKGAKILGVHMEGPFISEKALGAMHREWILKPSYHTFCRLTKEHGKIVRLLTLAPELEGAEELIKKLLEQGIVVQAGHTTASFEEGEKAFALGVRGVCHFFNASPAIHHRAPGILTSALLNDAVYAECIGDLTHIHPGAVKLLCKTKGHDKVLFITDAAEHAGQKDGTYHSHGQTVYVKQSATYNEAGHLCGSGSMLLDIVKKAVQIGISKENALQSASYTQRKYLNITHGQIARGQKANFLLLNEQMNVQLTVMEQEEYKEIE